MHPSNAVQDRAGRLIDLANSIREQCSSTMAVDTDSCASAAVAIEQLVGKMWQNNDPSKEARYLAASDRILAKFGSVATLTSGATLSDLAAGIAKDAKKALAVGGFGVLMGAGVALVVYALSRGVWDNSRTETRRRRAS